MNKPPTLDRLPVAVVAYRRPEHLRQTLSALANTLDFEMVDVSIHIDGARGLEDSEENFQCVRVSQEFSAAMSERGLRPPTIEHQACNRGLYRSILATVDQVTSRYGRCVVLEDDLLVAPSFVRYMHESLRQYEGDKRVVQISAHCHDNDWDSCSFLPLTTSWGWATWQDRWRDFGKWLEQLPQCRQRRFTVDTQFDFGASYPYSILELLQDNKYASSWAIRFYRFAYDHNLVSLFPQSTLVTNIGFDGSGENCGKGTQRSVRKKQALDFSLPDLIEVDERRVRATQCKMRGSFRHLYFRNSLAMVSRWMKKAYQDR